MFTTTLVRKTFSPARIVAIALLHAHVTAKGGVYGRSHTYRRRHIASDSYGHTYDENDTRLQAQYVFALVVAFALLACGAHHYLRNYRLMYGSHLPGWPGSRRARLFAHSRRVLALDPDDGGRTFYHTNGDLHCLDELVGKVRAAGAAITCVNVSSNDISDCGKFLRVCCPRLARLDLTNNDLCLVDAARNLPDDLRVLVLRQNDLTELHGLSKLVSRCRACIQK